MNQYNPYAAPPTAPPNFGPAGVAAAGQPQPWEIGEVWSLGFDRFKNHGLILILAYFVYLILGVVPGQAPTILVEAGILERGSIVASLLAIVAGLVGMAVSAFLGVGFYRMALQVARGQTPSFGELFSGGTRFLPLLGANLLLGLIVGLGVLFIIVPGIILGCGLFFTQFFVIDAELGPIEALSASWTATTGHKLNLFLCGLLAAVLGVVSIGCCGVGFFFVAPLCIVVAAIIYTRLSGRGPALAGPPGGGYGGPPGGPPGYGGPPAGGYGGPPGGGYGGPPGGGYGGPPGGGYGGPPGGGGFGGPPGGGGYGPPGGGGGGYGPPGGGGGYGPPGGGGGGYGPPGGGGGYGPPR